MATPKAPAAATVIFVPPLDYALAAPATCIVVDVPILNGLQNVQSTALKVRSTLGTLLSILTNPSKVARDNFSNLYPCPSVRGVYTTVFCCEEWLPEPPNSNSTGCCSRTGFDLGTRGIGRLFKPETDRSSLISSASVTLTTTQVSTATASISRPSASTTKQIPQTVATTVDPGTSSKPSSNKRDLTIGVGVGLPVTIIALTILGIFLLRQRRRKRHAEGATSNGQSNWVRNSHGITATEFIDGIPRELSATAIGPNELHCSYIHEAGNGDRSRDNLSRA